MNSGYSSINPILDLLANSPITPRYDVLLYENTTTEFQLKLGIEFIDQSILFTNDYVGSVKRKYAFHW